MAIVEKNDKQPPLRPQNFSNSDTINSIDAYDQWVEPLACRIIRVADRFDPGSHRCRPGGAARRADSIAGSMDLCHAAAERPVTKARAFLSTRRSTLRFDRRTASRTHASKRSNDRPSSSVNHRSQDDLTHDKQTDARSDRRRGRQLGAGTLAKAHTLTDGARLTEKKIAPVLATHRIRRITAADVLATLKRPAPTVTPGTTDAARAHITTVAEQLNLVNRQIKDVTRRLDALADQLAGPEIERGQEAEQRDPAILRSLPGMGKIALATLLAEAHQAIRARDCHALRPLTGVAPVTKRSGKSSVTLNAPGLLRAPPYRGLPLGGRRHPARRPQSWPSPQYSTLLYSTLLCPTLPRTRQQPLPPPLVAKTAFRQNYPYLQHLIAGLQDCNSLRAHADGPMLPVRRCITYKRR